MNTQSKTGAHRTLRARIGAASMGRAFARSALAAKASLVFTPSNSDVAQKLVFKDAQDADALNGIATFTLTAAGVTGASVVATEKDKDIVPSACTIAFDTSNDWGNGENQTVVLTNTGATTISDWVMTWTESSVVTLSNSWNATVTQSARDLSAKPVSCNATLAPGAHADFGLTLRYSGAKAMPTNARLAGQDCTVSVK